MTIDATVLVADDSMVIRAVVRAGLEAYGYRVTEADDGAAAIEQCRRHAPDVVLLDIEMPTLNGYQVLAQLKSDPQLKDIPIVFLTIRTGVGDVVDALRGGAHDYLKKPFEPDELVARVGAALQVKRLQDQLREHNALLEQMNRTDTLTGLYNRRHLEEELARQHLDAHRHGDPIVLLLLDLDQFKRVNDTYGHPAGDLVLCEFARRLREQVRAGDTAGRWGGEEFLVILPRTDLAGAMQLADRIRTTTADSPIVVGSDSIHVTVSGGCAIGPVDAPGELVRLADARMYAAKRAGRNQIVSETPAERS
jgi:two-component system, cell cycle response regulator